MMEKMTFLVVPLINDVFHTSYPADVEIVQLRNEYQRWMVRLLRILGC